MKQASNNFISFEGIDGSGKSTQAKMLASFLEERNIAVTLTREPGGTKISETIRNILVNDRKETIDSTTELLLQLASRADHVRKVIRPALDLGKIVICDRFLDSTFAYQGYGNQIDLKIIEQIHHLAFDKLIPDITFLIDLDPAIAFERIKQRNGNNDQNHYDKMDLDFFIRVRNGFLEQAKSNPKRIIIIDGNRDLKEVHEEIVGVVMKKFLVN